MNVNEIIFVGSYGGRGTRLLRPDGSSYTNGGPKSLLFVGGLPLGGYTIIQALSLGVLYFLISVNRKEDADLWEMILTNLKRRYDGFKPEFNLGLHSIGKPTDVFASEDTLRFLSRYPKYPILWCFGDDYLPDGHLEFLLEEYRRHGRSVATRKHVSKFNGVLDISNMEMNMRYTDGKEVYLNGFQTHQ
ncbi:MAG: hypothetical protein QXY45_00325 [Candidatus Aenigmatarchaeota archaeon]